MTLHRFVQYYLLVLRTYNIYFYCFQPNLQITVYKVPVKLTIDKQGDSFKPGLIFLVIVIWKILITKAVKVIIMFLENKTKLT